MKVKIGKYSSIEFCGSKVVGIKIGDGYAGCSCSKSRPFETCDGSDDCLKEIMLQLAENYTKEDWQLFLSNLIGESDTTINQLSDINKSLINTIDNITAKYCEEQKVLQDKINHLTGLLDYYATENYNLKNSIATNKNTGAKTDEDKNNI